MSSGAHSGHALACSHTTSPNRNNKGLSEDLETYSTTVVAMFQRASLVSTLFVAFLATLTSAQSIANFTLVNANANKDIRTLRDGETFTKPSSAINVRANTSPDEVGLVVFEVNGTEFRIENVFPYALAGDNEGNYLRWDYPVGSEITITATPYSEANGEGSAGTPLNISFTIVDSPPSRTPTLSPSAQPTSEPASRPASRPTSGPTPGPASRPTSGPTPGPASRPTSGPTPGPASRPTSGPTPGPASRPTSGPTPGPASRPTSGPTTGPTPNLTLSPTLASPSTSANNDDGDASVETSTTDGVSITEFVLINADADEKIATLSDNYIIDLSDTGPNLNIKAKVTEGTNSVVFGLNDDSEFRIENYPPFALAANSDEDYYGWTPRLGEYTLTATAYTEMNGSGTAGEPLTINFTVVQVASKGEQRQWHRMDITFNGPSTSETASPNPFLQYRLQVIFTQSNQRFNVPGYYAGDGNGGPSGNKWRVHFAPPTTGTWSYVASFRKGTNINISTDPNAGTPTSFDGESGSFDVAASNKSGSDFRSPDKGLLKNRGDHYLTFASGTPWVKGGPNIPENFLSRPFTAHGGRIGALDFIASYGANSIYFLPNNIGGDGDDVWPYIEKYATDELAVRFDTAKLDGWEELFLHAESKGIFLHFVFAETEVDNENYHDNGSLGIERKLFYRHFIARYGHHNGVEWNIGEENDYGTTKRKQFASWIKDVDPYDHPVTTHTNINAYESYNDLLGDANFDMTSFQGRASSVEMANLINDWRERSRNAGAPWAISFDEPQRIENSKTDQVSGYAYGRRDKMWPVYMAGGAGFEWFIQNKGGGFSLDQTIDDYREMDVALEWTGYALDFLRQVAPSGYGP